MAKSRRRRRRLLILGAIVLLVVGVAAWLGLSWLQTYRTAQSFQAEASSLRAAVSARDWQSVASLLPQARESARAFDSSTQNLAWRVLQDLPFIGSDGAAVAEVAAAANFLLGAAEPLADYAERIDELRRPDGSVDLELVSEMGVLLERLDGVVARESTRLNAIDVDQLRPELAGPVTELRDELNEVKPVIATASEVLTRVPALLGGEGERTWLVLLQNPAESRGTGGFPGAYVTISVDQGKPTITSTGKLDDFQGVPIPTTGAPEDSRLMWGGLLTSWNTFNMSADFPMVADLAAAGIAARGQEVDGVIALDPRVVAAMLAVVGPVTAAGQTLTAENAERFFTVDSYALYPDMAERADVTLALVSEILRTFLTSAWDPLALADALSTPISDGRVKVWSADPEQEAWLLGTPIGGGVPDTPGSIVAVAFDNAAGNKMDAFVSTVVDYRPGTCPTTRVQDSGLTVTMRNDAPDSLPLAGGNYGRADDPTAPAGSTKLLVYVYAPVGATFGSATLNGQPVEMYVGSERNRPVWWTSVVLERGQEQVIDLQFAEPTVPGVEPTVLRQAMVIDEVVTVTPDPSC